MRWVLIVAVPGGEPVPYGPAPLWIVRYWRFRLWLECRECEAVIVLEAVANLEFPPDLVVYESLY